MLLPERFVANEEKVNTVNDLQCVNCSLSRRTNLSTIYTPGREIDPAVIQTSKDIFEMSVNIVFCHSKIDKIESYPLDVNIVADGVEKEILNLKYGDLSEWNRKDVEPVSAIKYDTAVVLFVVKNVLNIAGRYPYASGTPNEKVYNYKLVVEYDPLVLNVYHFVVNVYTNENGNFEKLDRNSKTSKKKYIRSLASSIRNEILRRETLTEILP